MALPAQGAAEYTPGQAPQPVGTWRHRPTGQTLTVTHPAGADALAAFKEQDERGNYFNSWEFVGEDDGKKASSSRAKQLDEGGDSFSVSKLASGEVRYFKNGKRISKAVYEQEAPKE